MTRGELAETTGELAKTFGDLAKTTGELAKTFGELAKTTGEFTKTFGELAKTTGELAKTRGEIAKTRGELVETRGEVANATDAFSQLFRKSSVCRWISSNRPIPARLSLIGGQDFIPQTTVSLADLVGGTSHGAARPHDTERENAKWQRIVPKST